MKKLITFMLLAVTVSSFCQQTTTSTPTVKSDYLKKSKSQKAAAWILVGGGAALITTGIIVGGNAFENDPLGYSTSGAGSETVLFVAGLVAIGSSVPLFIASARNKKKAMAASVFFKMEKAPLIKHATIASQSYPVVSVKINLR